MLTVYGHTYEQTMLLTERAGLEKRNNGIRADSDLSRNWQQASLTCNTSSKFAADNRFYRLQ